jgi:hypothetical protein
MGPLEIGVHAANILFLLGLLYIYAQNYRQVKSKLTLGLVLFVLIFLAHSLMNIYFELTMVMYDSLSAKQAALVLEAVKAVSFGLLLWISWE